MSGRKYYREQRERFFDLIDRGGPVRAAARAANPECPSNRGRTLIGDGLESPMARCASRADPLWLSL